MQHVQFDSFGEPLPQHSERDDRSTATGSRLARLTGMTVFWSLVIVIVSARAFYFDPGFAATFEHVAQVSRAIRTALGV